MTSIFFNHKPKNVEYSQLIPLSCSAKLYPFSLNCVFVSLPENQTIGFVQTSFSIKRIIRIVVQALC